MYRTLLSFLLFVFATEIRCSNSTAVPPNTIHFRGRWVYEHRKGSHQPILLNYSRVMFTNSFKRANHGPICGTNGSQRILVNRTHYTWVAAEGSPALEPFSAYEFLRLVNGQNITYVGDSMQYSFFTTLVASLEAGGAKVVEMIWPEVYRRAAIGEIVNTAQATVHSWKVSVPEYPPIMLRFVTSRSDFVHYQTFDVITPQNSTDCAQQLLKGAAFEFPTNRWLNNRDYLMLKQKTKPVCYHFAWTWVLPYTDILVLNLGQWYHHYDASFTMYPTAVRNTLAYLAQHYKGRIVYKATGPGHQPACSSENPTVVAKDPAPTIVDLHPMELEDAMRLVSDISKHEASAYRWDMIRPAETAWQEQGAAWPADRFIFSDDFDAFVTRPDGKVDCVHYCPSGPVLWTPLFLYKTLKQLLTGSP